MIVASLVVYFAVVGLDEADKVASGVGAVVALVALGAPYLLPAPGGASVPEPDRIEDTGKANATSGGRANTGFQALDDDRPVQVARSGDAVADGSGSVANTGIQRQRRP
ncbi:hypothetical protein [Pseudofrankia sp. BMG5.37]|uniref:hypothetical protein n=1 Tax=Pseudofrankia sp. BMG5.37 TaxID=3050035 RepID=UPI002895F0A4|nr:hypothetical protein [Pseudofrankia sp. BMG5.37]MDT3442158.1 hypothetical protein [Pseudofrankia sp. BMG5.37]